MKSEMARDQILMLEGAALERWCNGDPSGFLEISAEDVTYFDPFQGERIDGLPALTAYYESLRGKIFATSHEIVAPWVQCYGDVAVLTFRFHSRGKQGDELRWNCTEVYRLTDRQWRIVQTHWSFNGACAAVSNTQ